MPFAQRCVPESTRRDTGLSPCARQAAASLRYNVGPVAEMRSLLRAGRLQDAWDLRTRLTAEGDAPSRASSSVDALLLFAVIRAATDNRTRWSQARHAEVRTATAEQRATNLEALAASSDEAAADVAWVLRVAELWHSIARVRGVVSHPAGACGKEA